MMGRQLQKTGPGVWRVLGCALVMLAGFSSGANAECKYLGHYLAPMKLPLDAPVSLVGPKSPIVTAKLVGPDECKIIKEQSIRNASGVPYRHVTMGVSGTLFGFTATSGLRQDQFADTTLMMVTHPNYGPFYPGVMRYTYSEATPAGMEILLPENPQDWNGKLWMLAHGGGYYSSLTLIPRKPGVFNRYQRVGQFAGILIDQGYVVVWTRRGATTGSSQNRPVETVRLDDERVVGGEGQPGKSFTDHVGWIRDITEITRAFLEEQLGSKPEYTFAFGHSGGGSLLRSVNLVPGMNVDHQGNKLFHGLYHSDTAGGRAPPSWHFEAEILEGGAFQLRDSDKDHLVYDDQVKASMAYQIEEYHMLYAGPRQVNPPGTAQRLITTYINLKQEAARIFLEKGLGDIVRTYEIDGVSHGDASGLRRWPEVGSQMVDLAVITPTLMDALVQWASTGTEPPDSRSAARDVRELDPKIGREVALPEVACPRGVYREYLLDPNGNMRRSNALLVPYETKARLQWNADSGGLEPPPGFDKEWLEPLDGRGYLVDMDNSTTRTTRPSMGQAWRDRNRKGYETGILGPYELLTRARYVSCVTRVAEELHSGGFLTDEALKWYRQKAQSDVIGEE